MPYKLNNFSLYFIFTLSLIIAKPLLADVDTVRINEVMAGYNGDSRVQFIELLAPAGLGQWGPAAGESSGRMQLQFFGRNGELRARFVFPSEPNGSGQTILIATREFAELNGAPSPDFIMAPSVAAISGRICWRSNPDNANAAKDVDHCVSYGDYAGSQGNEGLPHAADLAILGASSLRRDNNFDSAMNALSNADFSLAEPTPSNSHATGDTGFAQNQRSHGGHVFAALDQVAQGRNLFDKETFDGNGRTCGTCHIPPFFNMTPDHISAKDPSDPLFIAEWGNNINHLTITTDSASGFSQPSDLHGGIRDESGVQAEVIAGSGSHYLVRGGLSLSGAIEDDFGNRASVVSVSAGNLSGPNPVNGNSDGLEDPTGFMLSGSTSRNFPQGRALVLENINGFNALPNFRKSPHLINLKQTAPFGLSGEFDLLDDFNANAISQHFTRDLQRRTGIDFRPPTQDELAALTAFQESLVIEPFFSELKSLPLGNVTTLRQFEGEKEFFSVGCRDCHSGKLLSETFLNSAPPLFNTGVANQKINSDDGLPAEPPEATESVRAFNVPSLFNVRHLAPYFHDNSTPTLKNAVRFYNSPAFKNAAADFPTPVGGLPLGGILTVEGFQISETNVDRLESFLRTLAVYPFEYSRLVKLPDTFLSQTNSETITLTNTSDKPLMILASRILHGDYLLDIGRKDFDLFVNIAAPLDQLDCRGPDQFTIDTPAAGTIIQPGNTLSLNVTFTPNLRGPRVARLELTLGDGEESYEIGASVFGWAVDSAIPGSMFSDNSCRSVSAVLPDAEGPVFFPLDDLVFETSQIETPLDLPSPMVMDARSEVTIRSDAPPVFPLGDTIVTWVARDMTGNITRTKQKVTLLPVDLALTVHTQNITREASALETTLILDEPSVTGAVGEFTLSHNAPEFFPLGETAVLWQVTDSEGNTAEATQTVSIVDTTPPELVQPDELLVEATGPSTPVTLNEPVALDAVAVDALFHDAPASFALGTTIVNWTARDTSGNESQVSQRVKVVDSTAPVITIKPMRPVEATAPLTSVLVPVPDVTDAVSVEQWSHDGPDAYPVGETRVLWTATDSSGNESQAEQVIIVVDTTAPDLAIPGDLTVEATAELSLVDIGQATATDAVGISEINHDAPAFFALGETIVTWHTRDVSGQEAQAQQRIRVRDTTPPLIEGLETKTFEASGPQTALTLAPPRIIEAVSSFVLTNDQPDSYPLGLTRITWQARDSNGNQSEATQDIWLVDSTPPRLTAPADIKLVTDLEEVAVDLGEAHAEDALGIAEIGHDAPALFTPGEHVVTWTATDTSGNSSQATQKVEILYQPTTLKTTEDTTETDDKKKGGLGSGSITTLIMAFVLLLQRRRMHRVNR